METYLVRMRIFKPIKIAFMRDDLTGTFDNNKRTITNIVPRLYINSQEHMSDDLETAHWTLEKNKRYKGLGNSHDSVIQADYLKKEVYKRFHTDYLELEGKIESYNNREIKYSIKTVIPLIDTYHRTLWPEDFIHSYFHHPRKEFVTNDTKKMEAYLRRWVIKEGDLGRRELFITRMLEEKRRVDKEVPEGGIFCTYWED